MEKWTWWWDRLSDPGSSTKLWYALGHGGLQSKIDIFSMTDTHLNLNLKVHAMPSLMTEPSLMQQSCGTKLWLKSLSRMLDYCFNMTSSLWALEKGGVMPIPKPSAFLKFCLHFVCMYYRKGGKDKVPACVLNYVIPSWMSALGTSVELYEWKYPDSPLLFGSKTKSSYTHINEIATTKRIIQWLHHMEQNCIINQAKTEATKVKESWSIFLEIVDVMKHMVNVEESTVSTKKHTHSEFQSGCNDPSECPKMKDSDDPNVIQYKIFWSETGNKRKKEKKAADSTTADKVPLEFPNTQEWWAKLREERIKHKKNMLQSTSSKEVDAKAVTVASGKTLKVVTKAMIDKLNPETTWWRNFQRMDCDPSGAFQESLELFTSLLKHERTILCTWRMDMTCKWSHSNFFGAIASANVAG